MGRRRKSVNPNKLPRVAVLCALAVGILVWGATSIVRCGESPDLSRSIEKTVYISPSAQEDNLFANGLCTEEENANAVADELEILLKNSGFTVYRNDPAWDVKQIADESNRTGAAVHVAIHSNAAGAAGDIVRGCEVLTRPADMECSALAWSIYNRMEALTPTADRSVKERDDLVELKQARAVTVLVEMDFHDNEQGADWLVENRAAIAEAIYAGIMDYYEGIE